MAKFDKTRMEIMTKFTEILKEEFDVLQTNSNELCIPIVEDTEEGYLVMTFKIPKGSRDGDIYDGYAMAEEYQMKCKAKEEKAKKQAEEKAKKKARDEKRRKQMAEQKEKRENN